MSLWTEPHFVPPLQLLSSKFWRLHLPRPRLLSKMTPRMNRRISERGRWVARVTDDILSDRIIIMFIVGTFVNYSIWLMIVCSKQRYTTDEMSMYVFSFRKNLNEFHLWKIRTESPGKSLMPRVSFLYNLQSCITHCVYLLSSPIHIHSGWSQFASAEDFSGREARHASMACQCCCCWGGIQATNPKVLYTLLG